MKAKVVILNWNGMEHLKRFLPSVVATTPDNIGIVLADNGSTDGSPEMVAGLFPDIKIISLDRNYGFAGGYNLALSHLTADYFILLNSDVETAKEWCEPLIEALERDPQLMAVSPKILSYSNKEYFEYAGAAGGFIDILGYPFCRGRILSAIEKDEGQYNDARNIFWASGACMACRRELFSEIGGFDSDFFAHMEEIDLCWRAQLHGYKIGVEPRSVVYHLGGGTLPNSSPRKIYLNYRNSLATIYKNSTRSALIFILPIRIAMDWLSSAVYLLQGKFAFFRSVYRAHFDFYRWLGKGLSDNEHDINRSDNVADCDNCSFDQQSDGKEFFAPKRVQPCEKELYNMKTKGLRAKRKEIRWSAVARPTGIYRGSVILRYILGKRKFAGLKTSQNHPLH